jgi:hypothetical protein
MLYLLDTIPEGSMSGPDASPVTGSGAPKLRPRLTMWTVTDPAEPWEIPVAKRDRYKIDRMLPGRPFRPAKTADIPPVALVSLQAVCGSLPFEQLYIIPKTTRLVSSDDCVITPTKVIGFGERDIGLWIDDGPDGRLTTIPIDQLLAVDDRTILLYGRLRLIASDSQLVVRYNTVSRTDVQENLAQVRARMATTHEPVESGFLWLDPQSETRGQRELPHKWRVALENAAVRPDLTEPVIIAAGDVTEVKPGRSRPASGVAVLGASELVIANEPVEYLDRARYGVDLLAVPRRRLDSLGWDGRSLTVRVALDHTGVEAATTVTLPLDPYLAEAMWRAFGSAVRWA